MTMTETERLLAVFRVDNSIEGLQGRLRAAERFLAEQERQLADVEGRHGEGEQELRRTKASLANAENEAKSLDEKIEAIRERMNSASSNKEYQAYLTELATYRERKGEQEAVALELMQRIETLTASQEELAASREERVGVCRVAQQQRNERASEIKDRLDELKAERERLIADVPEGTLTQYLRVRGQLGEEAMAPVEVIDAKRHEFVCGISMLSVPVETVSALLSHGRVTTDPQSGAILYLSEEARKAMEPVSKR